MVLCVLPDQYNSMQISRAAYAQIDVVTCQPHERCRPIDPIFGSFASIDINIGKYGLG